MDPLTLESIILHDPILCVLLLHGIFGRVLLDVGDNASHVRKDEKVRIGDLRSQVIMALIRHIDRMLLLVYDEVERIRDLRHLPFVVLHVEILRFLENLLDTRLRHVLDERLILRKAPLSTEQELASVGLVSC